MAKEKSNLKYIANLAQSLAYLCDPVGMFEIENLSMLL